MRTDADWIAWSQRDPYFAVLTQPQYRSQQLDESAREAFFAEGRAHVAHLQATVRAHLDAGFQPERALDFGCGVGRVVLPLLDLPGMAQVVGVDIAPQMLEETRRNCSAEQSSRFLPILSDAELGRLQGEFDLVHSCIVFQHIPPAYGMRLLERLLCRVRQGGIAAIQLPYGWLAETRHRGQLRRWKSLLRVAGLRGWHWLHARFKRRPVDPVMEMHAYPLNEVLFLFHQSGFSRLHLEFTDHGGALGVSLYGRRDVAASHPAERPAADSP